MATAAKADLASVLLGISQTLQTMQADNAALVERLAKLEAGKSSKSSTVKAEKTQQEPEVFLIDADTVRTVDAPVWGLLKTLGLKRNSDGTIVRTRNAKGLTVGVQDETCEFNGNDRRWAYGLENMVKSGKGLTDSQIDPARRLITKAVKLGLIKPEAVGAKKPVGRPKKS